MADVKMSDDRLRAIARFIKDKRVTRASVRFNQSGNIPDEGLIDVSFPGNNKPVRRACCEAFRRASDSFGFSERGSHDEADRIKGVLVGLGCVVDGDPLESCPACGSGNSHTAGYDGCAALRGDFVADLIDALVAERDPISEAPRG